VIPHDEPLDQEGSFHAEAWHDDRAKEECGIVGLYTPGTQAAKSAFFALFALQHRGQESAGICSADGESIYMEKGQGLVAQVFHQDTLQGLPGEFAIGHNRYSTTGANVFRNAQPIVCVTEHEQVAVGHNGNLVNTFELRKELEEEGFVFETTNDSELIAVLLHKHMHEGPEAAVAATMARLEGAYSVVALTPTCLLGFRDPNGIRPLSVGKIFEGGYLMASESCAFSPFGGAVTCDLEPGECAVIDSNGLKLKRVAKPARPSMCLFEFIYFARPDSHMYGTSLYDARERMGEALARLHPAPDADVVIPVPDSGIPAALGYSRASGLPYKEGMMKSRYIHRTFIQPDQRMRENGVRMKLSPMPDRLRGKSVVLVDDSIVRGTTTGQIVKLLFDSGAREVHVRITAPPITHPCFYGIDMASESQLIAANNSVEEIRAAIGATTLGYLDLEAAVRAVGKDRDHFCHACFSGEYPINVEGHRGKEALEKN
jgi:amidophosphoribosyltransferase